MLLGVAKQPSIYASGVIIDGLVVLGEILAVRENGVVFVVGFDRAPPLPPHPFPIKPPPVS